MPNGRRPFRGFAALLLSIVGLGITPTSVRADDPVLINPALQPGQVITTPYHATQEQWDHMIALLSLMYPNATYDDLETFVLITYGMLPPITSDPAPAISSPAPLSPPPVIAPPPVMMPTLNPLPLLP
jgi:hypothetical protein